MGDYREEKFNFKFLNRIMYIGAIIAIYYVLKNIGIVDMVTKALVALTPVYLGIIICWISMPLANKLRKIGLSKNLAAIISLIIIFGIIIVVLSIVIPMFIEQAASLIKDLPSIYSKIVEKVNGFISSRLGLETKINISDSIKNLDIVQKYLSNIVDYSITTIQSVISIVIAVGTTIVVSFFMVKDMDKFKSGVISLLSRNGKDKNRHKMINEIDITINKYIKGLFLDSFIVGLMTTVVCLILKLDYAIIFGILITILNLIPYIGAVLSYLIASLYALTVGGPALAIVTFISLLIVQIIDANILQPNIIGKSVELHPVVVLAGLVVFELYFGIVGMIIAVPIMSIIKVIMKYKLIMNIDEEEKV